MLQVVSNQSVVKRTQSRRMLDEWSAPTGQSGISRNGLFSHTDEGIRSACEAASIDLTRLEPSIWRLVLGADSCHVNMGPSRSRIQVAADLACLFEGIDTGEGTVRSLRSPSPWVSVLNDCTDDGADYVGDMVSTVQRHLRSNLPHWYHHSCSLIQHATSAEEITEKLPEFDPFDRRIDQCALPKFVIRPARIFQVISDHTSFLERYLNGLLTGHIRLHIFLGHLIEYQKQWTIVNDPLFASSTTTEFERLRLEIETQIAALQKRLDQMKSLATMTSLSVWHLCAVMPIVLLKTLYNVWTSNRPDLSSRIFSCRADRSLQLLGTQGSRPLRTRLRRSVSSADESHVTVKSNRSLPTLTKDTWTTTEVASSEPASTDLASTPEAPRFSMDSTYSAFVDPRPMMYKFRPPRPASLVAFRDNWSWSVSSATSVGSSLSQRSTGSRTYSPSKKPVRKSQSLLLNPRLPVSSDRQLSSMTRRTTPSPNKRRRRKETSPRQWPYFTNQFLFRHFFDYFAMRQSRDEDEEKGDFVTQVDKIEATVSNLSRLHRELLGQSENQCFCCCDLAEQTGALCGKVTSRIHCCAERFLLEQEIRGTSRNSSKGYLSKVKQLKKDVELLAPKAGKVSLGHTQLVEEAVGEWEGTLREVFRQVSTELMKCIKLTEDAKNCTDDNRKRVRKLAINLRNCVDELLLATIKIEKPKDHELDDWILEWNEMSGILTQWTLFLQKFYSTQFFHAE